MPRQCEIGDLGELVGLEAQDVDIAVDEVADVEVAPIGAERDPAIAESGGSVGIWHFFPSIDRYVDGLKEMADIVGVDHVSIGTDQFDARGCLEDYTRWVHLVAASCAAASPPKEAGKIAGGNYLRIFRAAVG